MPDPDDRTTTWPEAGSPDTHPVLKDMAEAAGVISDAGAYLSPTREFDEPSLEEGDWPRDLDSPETLRMVGHLAPAEPMTTAMPVAQDWPAMLTATRLAGHPRNAPRPAGGCVTLCGLATRHLKAGPVRELGS